MLKRTVLGALCAATLLVAGIAQAQENATIVLRSGERLNAQLVDLGGVGFTVRVNGQERQIPQNDVALIDFTGANITDSDWANFSGTQQVVLRNGQTLNAQLTDIGGTSPLRLSVRTDSGDRDLSSSEVARIIMARPTSSIAATTGSQTPTPAGGQTINVSSQQRWTATGITVMRGQTLTFNTTGQVQLSTDTNDIAGSAGSRNQRFAPRAPMPRAYAGALIGRIGNGQPFAIGDMSSVQMPASGQLFLGVNDDTLSDNQGAFTVVISKPGGVR